MNLQGCIFFVKMVRDVVCVCVRLFHEGLNCFELDRKDTDHVLRIMVWTYKENGFFRDILFIVTWESTLFWDKCGYSYIT